MWFHDISQRLYPRVGIDLGSQTTRLQVLNSDRAVEVTTCLAIDLSQERVLAIGEEAAEMEGRVGDHVSVVWPIRAGRIEDPAYLEAFLRAVLQRIFESSFFLRPIFMVTLPATTTEAEQELLTETIYAVGAREVYTIAQPLAAAIGAGVPIAAPTGSLLLQIGAEIAESAIISLSSCVATAASEKAGIYLDRMLQRVIAEEYHINISREQAAKLKEKQLSVAHVLEREVSITGQDDADKSPRTIQVSLETLRQHVEAELQPLIDICTDVLRAVPPELVVDVVDKGMLLSGAGAQLKGLDRYLTPHLGVPISIVEHPESAAVDGCMVVLENLELFKESVGYEL